VIEVKSRLDKKEVRDACEKIASVRRLTKTNYLVPPAAVLNLGGPPLSTTYAFVFAFSSRWSIKSITRNVSDWCDENPPSDWPDGVFILDRGSIRWFMNGRDQGCAVPGSAIGYVDQRPGDVLLMMLLNLHTAFANAWVPVNLQGYLPNAVFGVPMISHPAQPVWPAGTAPQN
jgi:hypothetical protein